MAEQLTIYVSPSGNDRWSGTLPEPNAGRSDGPFATLVRARDALRAARGPVPISPARVVLRGGTYRLERPLVLGPHDSGIRGAPVTWTAMTGESVVVSGGTVVTGWERERGDIWRADLPGSRGGKWRFRQLFCDGVRMTRARWPKHDPANPLYGGWAQIEDAAEPGSMDSFRYRPGTFPRAWARPTDVEVVYWANVGGWRSRSRISRMDTGSRVIELADPGWQFDYPGWYQPVTFTPGNRFYIENALEELDRPGEWCFDSEEGVLHFWPPGGTMEGAEVSVPLLGCLFDIRGGSWITLDALTFTETRDGDNFHHHGVEGAGAMAPRPGWSFGSDAVHLKDAEHCVVTGCCFREVGCNGVYLEGKNRRNRIVRNDFSGFGANGICLLGSRLRHPMWNEVSDNHIHHGGIINAYTAGVFLGMSDGNLVSHNLVEHLPHHAVNLSNSPYGRNIVEYNDIRWVDEQVADSAAINCWMEEPNSPDAPRCGHIIRFNRISDVWGCEVIEGKIGRSALYPTSGIYLDNYTSNCVVYGNLVMRCANAGILVHAGRNNLIENNIVADCGVGFRLQDYVSGMDFWKPMTGFMTGNHFLGNIVRLSGEKAFLFSLHRWTDDVLARSDGNIFFPGGGRSFAIEHITHSPGEEKIVTFEQWRAHGYDAGSIIADPLFEDAGRDDYRLLADSPAFRLGFVAIPLDRIGIRPA